MEPTDLAGDPLTSLRHWLADAESAGLPDPNAMVVSTAAPDGHPSSRTVLAKVIDDDGIVFFTNYESRKGRELQANPQVAIVFPWHPMGRQVCLTGEAALATDAESDAYFASRDRASQIGAWSSPQSRVLASRAELEALVAATEERFAGVEIPRPPFWGGVRVRPAVVDFWERRPSRLHDRLRFEREGTAWRVSRLAP